MPIYNEITLAKELIRFPSITPIDAGIMKFLAKKLTAIGFKCKILEFKEKNSKPVKNLYARLGTLQPNFMFAGHLDVVPPGNLKDWTIKPFNPSVKKKHLIGRGANDMKSAVASWIVAVSKFVSKNKKLNGSISLLLTGDEEGLAINGTKKVVEGVIVGEGSVLSMGMYIGQSTKIVNRKTGEITYGKVPPYSVVVPGSLPDKNNPSAPSLNCAVIIKQVDEKTRSKTSINDLLRE